MGRARVGGGGLEGRTVAVRLAALPRGSLPPQDLAAEADVAACVVVSGPDFADDDVASDDSSDPAVS